MKKDVDRHDESCIFRYHRLYKCLSSIQINRKLPVGFSEEIRSAVRMWILSKVLTCRAWRGDRYLSNHYILCLENIYCGHVLSLVKVICFGVPGWGEVGGEIPQLSMTLAKWELDSHKSSFLQT